MKSHVPVNTVHSCMCCAWVFFGPFRLVTTWLTGDFEVTNITFAQLFLHIFMGFSFEPQMYSLSDSDSWLPFIARTL